MSAPYAEKWEGVPEPVQVMVRDIYEALCAGANAEDRARSALGVQPNAGAHHWRSGLTVWEHLPERMKLAMANMLMAQRHETNRAVTGLVQSILFDKVWVR